MNSHFFALLIPFFYLGFSPHAIADELPDSQNWPGFRGPQARGVSEGYPLPLTWDIERGENVRWKVAVPGLGHSSPVIWGKRIYVTTAVGAKSDAELRVGLYGNINPVVETDAHDWKLICIDKQTGKKLWERSVHTGVPSISRHPKATHANSTPATDGEHVVVFLGSEGLYCYSVDGKLSWKKSFGLLDSGYFQMPAAQWGFGSSPIIYDGRVIIQCDVQKNSFVAAYNIKDGAEIWRSPRDEVPTWCTPTVYNDGNRVQVIVNGYKHIGAYDFLSGKELWKLKGGGDIPVPTPVTGPQLIYVTSAHGRLSPIYAIRSDVSGTITPDDKENFNKNFAWYRHRGGAYMQTPIVFGDLFYTCKDNGVLSCHQAETGKLVYRKRLTEDPVGFTASPVAGDGKIYFTGEHGDIYVLGAGDTFKVLAHNEMTDVCMATPAISQGTLYFRTQRFLMAIAKDKK